MNKKQKLAIILLSIFIIGMCIGAADAAHTVKKGKYKAKLSKKEYKKLTKTKTKYKTVTKTRTVEKTKTKEVEVNKSEYYNSTHTELYREYYDKKNGTSQTGYLHWNDRPASKYYEFENKSVNYNTNVNNCTYHIYNDEYGKYNTTESYTWTEWEPRQYKVNVTEKYTVKVPYKVRVNANVQKTVGYKKVKLDRVVGHKYKTVYKYKTVKLKQAVYNAKSDTYTSYRGTHQKYPYKDWKLVKTITKYKSDGSYIEYDIIKSKKKKAVKEKYPIIKAVKTKKPILMNIGTTDSANRLLKGKKVYVEIYCNGDLLRKGTAKIK